MTVMTGKYQVQMNYKISIMTMGELCRIMIVLPISYIKTSVDFS